MGTWSKGTDLIPTTKADELLGCLDISDAQHPVLHRSAPEGDMPNQPPCFPEISEASPPKSRPKTSSTTLYPRTSCEEGERSHEVSGSQIVDESIGRAIGYPKTRS